MVTNTNPLNMKLKCAKLNWEYGIEYNNESNISYIKNPISAFKTNSNKFIITDIELDSVLFVDAGTELKKEIFISGHNIKWAEEIENGVFAVVRDNSIEIYNEKKELLHKFRHPSIPNPCFVTAARNGRLFVADYKSQFVGEFTREGKLTWLAPSNLELKQPKSATLTKIRDHCLIVDDLSNWVIEVNMVSNEVVWSFGSKGKGGRTTDKLFSPKYSIDTDEGIIIVDSYTNRILCVSRDHEILWQYGGEFAGAGFNQLWRPTCCHYTDNKTFLITDSKNDRIIEVDKDKGILKTIGTSQIETCLLRLPRSIIQDSSNNYIIADTHANRIAILDANRESIVFKPTDNMELYWPRCVITIDNNYWVADGLNNRIIIFDRSFHKIKEIPSITINNKEYMLEDPHQISKSHYNDSYLVTSTSNNYVFRIDSKGDGLEVISDGKDIRDPHSAIETVDGVVLICDTGNSGVFIKYPNGNTKKLLCLIDSDQNLIKLNQPRFCCCYEDYFLLLDTGSRSLMAFQPDGKLYWKLVGEDIIKFDTNQRFYLDPPSFLYDPRWIFVTEDNGLLIADTGNNRVFSISLKFERS